MSIKNNTPPSGQVPDSKKPWITPNIQILDLDEARSGLLKNGHDKFARS